MLDVAIIGCGVVGAAAAYELSHYPLHTAIFEAENDVADCTTKANSAILHAGYDPEPGTRMARLNVEGVALAKEICARLDVPYRQCGSLVLALSPAELPHLQKLYENGLANGVPGIRLLSAEETRAMEPGLSPEVAGALYAPSAAIVSPWEYALAMAEVAVRNGVELHLSSPVTGIQKTASGWALTTPSGVVEARYVVNAAGIRADAVHDMAAPHRFTIQPTRGEYYLLDKSEGTRVQHVIFQCPNENGKGVLVAPTVHGNLIVGPNAEPVAGDDTACTAAGLAFVSAAARRSVPDIRFGESIRNFAGVRANVDTGDFVIGEAEGAPGFIDRCQRGGPHSGRPRGSACGQNGLPGRPHPGAVQGAAAGRKGKAHCPEPRLRPGDLPLRDHHRGRDPGRPAHRDPGHHHRRRQAPLQRRDGPLSGRLLRAPGAGAHQPDAGHRPAGRPAGQGRQQRLTVRNQAGGNQP